MELVGGLMDLIHMTGSGVVVNDGMPSHRNWDSHSQQQAQLRLKADSRSATR